MVHFPPPALYYRNLESKWVRGFFSIRGWNFSGIFAVNSMIRRQECYILHFLYISIIILLFEETGK